ncbi:MAG: hypothetical protein P1P89_17980 [Desulfobacterales bacterium]|nr:hypothetical protein [Desulfobacterales bacterium]
MVRAGVVEHPKQWEFCGYNEIQRPRKRKGIIDFDRLMDLLGFENYGVGKSPRLRGSNCVGELTSIGDVRV